MANVCPFRVPRRALMGRRRCRRVNDINFKTLINQNYKLEVSYTSMHKDDIITVQPQIVFVAIYVE